MPGTAISGDQLKDKRLPVDGKTLVLIKFHDGRILAGFLRKVSRLKILVETPPRYLLVRWKTVALVYYAVEGDRVKVQFRGDEEEIPGKVFRQGECVKIQNSVGGGPSRPVKMLVTLYPQ